MNLNKRKYRTIIVVLVVVTAFVAVMASQGRQFFRQTIYTTFPKEVRLKGEAFEVGSKDVYLRYPRHIRRYGKYLFVHDLHGESHFMHLYDALTLQHLTSFAKRGEGPEEVLQCTAFRITSPDSIWVLDSNKRQLTRWSLQTDKDSLLCVEKIRFSPTVVSPLDFVWKDSESLFVPDYSGECRFMEVNRQGDIIRQFSAIPSHRKQVRNMRGAAAQAWRSFIDIRPERQLLVSVTQLGDAVEIFQFDRGEHQVFIGPEGEPAYQTTSQGYAIPSGFMGYTDVQMTDRYIYAVFHGRDFKGDLQSEDGGHFLHVFDLKGNPVCRYVLDHAIYGIHIDEEQNVIWATDVNTDEQIIKFHLPEL